MIQIERLTKTYDRRRRHAAAALHDVTLTLPDRGFVCIVGPSGCGKTSLLNAVGGLDTFEKGTVRMDGAAAIRCGSRLTELERNRSFGYVFQNYYLLGEYSAAYNVWLGLHALELSHGEKLKRVMEALRAVDMERFARRAVGQLSGGQQQRVAIARALARRPRVIFADEPTGNLDEANTVNICTLLRRISKHSLVVMVTHEERIARFFADRIITLKEGRVADDRESWQRGGLVGGGDTLYAGELEQTRFEGEGISLRLLREADAAPLDLTVVVERDRILLKTDDPRTLMCGGSGEAPRLEEGKRPMLRLEDLEEEPAFSDREPADPPGKAGRSLGFGMLLREARHLFARKGGRTAGSRFFLAVLTLLTLFAVGDWLKVASIDPEDFITTHSNVLEFELDRGRAENTTLLFQDIAREYPAYLDDSGLDYDIIPQVSASAQYALTSFRQLDSESEILSGYSYVLLDRLDAGTLILGRMPEKPDEIVVDRWVLESLMERDGIVQNGITDLSHFLGTALTYSKKSYSPTIVGICDSGEPAVYLTRSALVSIGNAGNQVISLTELQRQFPGVYEDVTLAEDECMMIWNNAGKGYAEQVGGIIVTNCKEAFSIAAAIEADTYAYMVVTDGAVERMLRSMAAAHFSIYCPDKAGMLAYLNAGMPEELAGMIQVERTDGWADAWSAYSRATALRLDGRRIVTLSILLLSAVMLYLLQRSKVQERVGMAAVYRLLGIPGRKLAAIFALESVLASLTVVLPCAALGWAAVLAAEQFPSARLNILLPWYGAAGVFGGILLYHLVTSLLPLARLLRLPPARLAAQYDI